MKQRVIATMAAAGLVAGAAITAGLAIADVPDTSHADRELAVLPISASADGSRNTAATESGGPGPRPLRVGRHLPGRPPMVATGSRRP